jgi:hypothetical protein
LSGTTELLDHLSEIGATVTVTGDRLILRAGSTDIPGYIVKRVKEARLELLEALNHREPRFESAVGDTEHDAAWWRREYHVRTARRSIGKRSCEEAEELAWGDVQIQWHTLHGRKCPTGFCAGCDEPIGGGPLFDMGDGNRVHFDNRDCLILYGDRWRADATRGLLAMGLSPPLPES